MRKLSIVFAILAALSVLSVAPASANLAWDGASHTSIAARPLDGVGDSPIMP
jgi:hypothetical protein